MSVIMEALELLEVQNKRIAGLEAGMNDITFHSHDEAVEFLKAKIAEKDERIRELKKLQTSM